MSSFSDFLELELLDHAFGNEAYSAPATLYVALMTAVGGDAQTGTTITEATYTGYARTAVTNNATNFPAASGGSKANGTQIECPIVTAGSDTIVAMAICDAATVGNVLAWGDLAASKALTVNDKLVFEIGGITITLD